MILERLGNSIKFQLVLFVLMGHIFHLSQNRVRKSESLKTLGVEHLSIKASYHVNISGHYITILYGYLYQ